MVARSRIIQPHETHEEKNKKNESHHDGFT